MFEDVLEEIADKFKDSEKFFGKAYLEPGHKMAGNFYKLCDGEKPHYGSYYPVDFTEELISYYDTFYDYPVSEELAEAILEGDEMRAAKVSVSAE